METQNKNDLDKFFDSIKEENYRESFNDVENWLRREAGKSFEKPEKSKIYLLKHIFSEGRLKFAYLFLILILVGITSNFSVTRTEPVGIVMSWRVDKQNPEAIKKIDNFDWIDKSKLIVSEDNTEGRQVLTYKILIPSANPEEIENLKSELQNVKDIYSVNVIPISEPVKQPIYAVALEKLLKVDYEKNLVNPDDIKRNVFEQLKLAGIQNDVDLDVPSVGSAGKYVNFNFSKKPDSVRIKVHIDAINDYYIEKAIDDVDRLFTPVKIINDSILNTTVFNISGESVIPDVIMLGVQRNLDTLHLRLKNSETKRNERIEKFNKRIEKFNERMEKFNKNMEKFDKKMEKYNEKMKNLKIPDIEYHYEINEDGDINIDIDVDDIPEIDIDEIPEIDEKNFNFNFNMEELDNNLKIKLDTMNINIDMEKINKEVKENMEKVKVEMKKLKEEIKKNKINIDTSKINNYYYNDDEDDEKDEKDTDNNSEIREE
ncbi:MAG: hypothetical protein WC358_03610 [Ignavibacteria bacterium]|jgi:hypothetical protein